MTYAPCSRGQDTPSSGPAERRCARALRRRDAQDTRLESRCALRVPDTSASSGLQPRATRASQPLPHSARRGARCVARRQVLLSGGAPQALTRCLSAQPRLDAAEQCLCRPPKQMHMRRIWMRTAAADQERIAREARLVLVEHVRAATVRVSWRRAHAQPVPPDAHLLSSNRWSRWFAN